MENRTYQHSQYFSFYVKDPKLRHIHKACVKDRVLHHAVFRILYPIFDKTFIFDSYSCRIGKGTHGAVNRLDVFAKKLSANNSRNIWVLKCDVRKFFASINQDILLDLIMRKVKDENIIWLIEEIIKSFPAGLPLGNITSQLFANIYLNELDKFIKHRLKIKYYIRYCDDFVILSRDKIYLENLISEIKEFLQNKLKLTLHQNKIIIRKYRQGVDFLGYVVFPYHRILRKRTEKRIIRNLKIKILMLRGGQISNKFFNQTLQSYFGVLKHCNSYKIKTKMIKLFYDLVATIVSTKS